MEKKDIGSFIADLRKSSGMTQQQLADRLNVSNKTVSKWERGESYPEITLIPVIADVFGVTSDEILRSRVIMEIDIPQTSVPDNVEVQARASGGISIDDRLDTSMTKYKIISVISMGIAAFGVILMLILAFAMQQKEAGFGVCIVFAAAAVLTQAVNILRTRAVLREGSVPGSCYETFFKTIPYVFCTAAAAVLLALPVMITFELEFPDGTVMTDFVYYLQAARYMALSSLALYAVAIFITDRVLGRSSRYQDINIFPSSKIKPIIWLLVFIVLVAI